MKQNEFELLVSTGSIQEVMIFRPAGHDGWTIVAEGNLGRLTQAIETARGETRIFKNLDTPYQIIRASGWEGSVVLTG